MLSNISLKSYNTFGIEVFAKDMVKVNSIEQLKNVLLSPTLMAMDKLILGGGSNILFTKDYNGLVIHNCIKGIAYSTESKNKIRLHVGAGETWHDFVLYCVNNNYAGIENLSLIPGTVGAAPLQNIGAYGVEVENVIESVEAIKVTSGEFRVFNKDECKFGYRESIFKHELKGEYVITGVNFKLDKIPEFHIEYGDIRRVLEENNINELNIKVISDAVIQIRKSKIPDPTEIGNAGSFFKNPEIATADYEELKESHPNIPGYPTASGTKIPAGWLIEQAGWKGFRNGSIGVHAKQALVLVNYGGGTGIEIKNLSMDIQSSVNTKFGINLLPEVNFI